MTESNPMICPATMCPYMGVSDGSPWTGEVEGDCHTDCGWWDGEYCIAGGDLVGEILERADLTDEEIESLTDERPPPCHWEERCQWEQQAGDLPCPPRLALMTGGSPTDTLF